MTIKKASVKLVKADKHTRSTEDRIYPGYDKIKSELERWDYLVRRCENFHSEFNRIRYMQDPNMAMCREKAWDIQLRVKHEHDRIKANIDDMNDYIHKQTTKR